MAAPGSLAAVGTLTNYQIDALRQWVSGSGPPIHKRVRTPTARILVGFGYLAVPLFSPGTVSSKTTLNITEAGRAALVAAARRAR